MGLIDADALKDTITTDYYEHFTRHHDTDQIALVDMVCDDIDEAPTVQPEPGWISVKDRLPEPYERVLVYAPSRYDYGNFDMCVMYGFHCHLCTHHGVTYWMPLPEPPEEVQRNE